MMRVGENQEWKVPVYLSRFIQLSKSCGESVLLLCQTGAE